jgi:hypothetical protein
LLEGLELVGYANLLKGVALGIAIIMVTVVDTNARKNTHCNSCRRGSTIQRNADGWRRKNESD